MDIKNSKSILAKLLATEDVTVVHQKTQTASFDTKNRVLTLPVWKDMDGNLYDLLVGHEVGHALETPAEGWHDAIEKTQRNRAFAGFLNVVEDARIEKKIKARFPGLRPSFYAAYQQLLDRDFFGLKKSETPVNEMLLIDRLNLHFKVGARLQVEFDETEMQFVRRMHDLETWDDTEKLARDLFQYCRQELEEKQQQMQTMKAMPAQLGESDEDEEYADRMDLDLDMDEEQPMGEQDVEPVSQTDEAFRNQEKQLLDSACLPYHTFTMADYDSSQFVVPWKKTMETMVFMDEQEPHRARVVTEFNRKNSQYVIQLVQQFERRRRAAELVRARTGKSGELDMKKIFNYQLTEDVFRRFTVLPQGKNHGLIMVIDMSGSMQENFGNTLEQTLILVQFCRKLNIPFEVYGFSNSSYSREELGHHDYDKFMQGLSCYQENDIVISDTFFTLRQYLTDAMPAQAFKRQFSNLVMLLNAFGTKNAGRYREPGEFPRYVPDANRLNGTPLNEAILLLPDLHRRFKERTRADIVNLVVLTDGESDDRLTVRTSSHHRRYVGIPETVRNNVILVDRSTKKSVQLQPHDRRGTKGLLRLVAAKTGCRILGFHILLGSGSGAIRQALFQYQDYDRIQPELNKKMQEMRKNDVVVSLDQGYDEHYLIRGGAALQVQSGEFEVEDSTDIKKIQKAFIKARSSKIGSRVLLNRFIEMIA